MKMTTREFKNRIGPIWDTLRTRVISGAMLVVGEQAPSLFIKEADRCFYSTEVNSFIKLIRDPNALVPLAASYRVGIPST